MSDKELTITYQMYKIGFINELLCEREGNKPADYLSVCSQPSRIRAFLIKRYGVKMENNLWI